MSEPIASPTPITRGDITDLFGFLRVVSAEIHKALNSGPVHEAIAEFQAIIKAATNLASDHQEETRTAFENSRRSMEWTPADGYH